MKKTQEGDTPLTPKGLTAKAKAAWRDIMTTNSDTNLLEKPDSVLLEVFANSLAIYRTAAAGRSSKKVTYDCPTKAGGVMTRVAPEVQTMLQFGKLLQSLASEFGMTPAARARLLHKSDNSEFAQFDGLLGMDNARPQQPTN